MPTTSSDLIELFVSIRGRTVDELTPQDISTYRQLTCGHATKEECQAKGAAGLTAEHSVVLDAAVNKLLAERG